jgi:integrase/recombinase XerD
MLLKTRNEQKVPDTVKQISYSGFTQNICLNENPVKQAKTLTPIDLRRVLDYIATRPHSVRNRAMLLMTYYSGVRVGEVASLRYSDIVEPDKTIRSEFILRPEQTKGNESRTVFVSEKLKKELEIYVKATKFTDPFDKFFYTQKRISEGFNANTLTQHFHHLYKRAGIAGASSHSGRRSFITNLASKGVSVRVLASLAGHKSIATTQRYIEIGDHQKRSAVELI